jgi:hypothetical protein
MTVTVTMSDPDFQVFAFFCFCHDARGKSVSRNGGTPRSVAGKNPMLTLILEQHFALTDFIGFTSQIVSPTDRRSCPSSSSSVRGEVISDQFAPISVNFLQQCVASHLFKS